MPGFEASWFDYFWSVELLLFIPIRWEKSVMWELSVLVNVKSEPTIVSAGFEKNLAGDAWPGSFAAWCRMCVCVRVI